MACSNPVATVKLPKTQEKNPWYVTHFRHCYSSERREAVVCVGLSHIVHLFLLSCMPLCMKPMTQVSEKQLGSFQVS